MPIVAPRNSRPTKVAGAAPLRYASAWSTIPRARSIIAATIHSATAVTNPALACVTSTPCRLAAATSMVLMSTAQRMKAASRGSAANSASGPAVCR